MTHEELDALLLAAEEDNKRGNCANAETLAHEAIQHVAEEKTSASKALHVRALLTLSESLWRHGLTKDALPIAEQALDLLTDSTYPETKAHKAKALNNIGNVYRRLSDYDRALEYYEKALALNEELGNKDGVAASIGNIGIVYEKLSLFAKALEFYVKALALREEVGNKGGAAITIGNIGVVYFKLSQYANALEYYEKALALDKELDNKDGVARHTSNIGQVYNSLSDYPKALEYYQKALALHEELGNKDGVARDGGNIGILYWHISEYAKALEYFEKALAVAEELGCRTEVAAHLGNIGNVYLYLSENDKAREYYEKALVLNEEIGDKAGVARDTGNIGSVFANLSQHTIALEYYEKALNLSKEIGARSDVGYFLDGIGRTLQELGRNEEAMEYLKRALDLCRKEIESNVGVADTLINIGLLLAKENQFEEAIEQLEEGLAIADKLGEKKQTSEAHKELAAIFARQGEMAKAFEHQSKYIALDKEIFSDDTRKRVEAFNFRVAIANRERDAELARLKAERVEEQLRLKERDLANTASSLAAQTELLGNFRADLRKIVLRPDRYEPEDIIKQVREKLKELPCEMIDFSKFEGQFATVHPEFRAKLETKYPELTAQEVKMCMLVHVNLKNAAIARLMCLSERTVEKHRENIRKKFDLKKGEDLSELLRRLDGK